MREKWLLSIWGHLGEIFYPQRLYVKSLNEGMLLSYRMEFDN